jgi:hypothetical protein
MVMIERRGLDHQDQLAAVGGECLPDRDREDDAAEEQEPRHAAGAGGLHLLMRHGLQAAADDLAGIGRRVERERENRAPIGLAEEAPEAPFLKRRAELTEAVIDEEDLDEERRAAEDEDIASRDPVEHRDAGHPHECEQHGEHGAQRDGGRRQVQRQRHTFEKAEKRLLHEREVHQAALRTPRSERSSAFWKNTVETQVIKR